jgi:hypothetical protein
LHSIRRQFSATLLPELADHFPLICDPFASDFAGWPPPFGYSRVF